MLPTRTLFRRSPKDRNKKVEDIDKIGQGTRLDRGAGQGATASSTSMAASIAPSGGQN